MNSPVQKVQLVLTLQEQKDLMALIDLAIRAGGFNVAKTGVVLGLLVNGAAPAKNSDAVKST